MLKTRLIDGGLTEIFCEDCGASQSIGEDAEPLEHAPTCPARTDVGGLCGCTVYREPHPRHREHAYKGDGK